MIAAACYSFVKRFLQESEGTYDSVSAVSATTGERPRISGAAASAIGNTVLEPSVLTICAWATAEKPLSATANKENKTAAMPARF